MISQVDLFLSPNHSEIGDSAKTAPRFQNNDSGEEQYQRFREQEQQRTQGDEEAMVMDEDYIRALSYGMPPAAGFAIGIDRLVMLLSDTHNLREVILFPTLRPR